ncbi:MAG: FCD domain-containing protein [Thiolinea sp.]
MSLYETLRSDIMMGAFAPGSKLKIETLKERYGTGVNVLRESLTRLSCEGLVEAEDQKGFRVTEASATRLSDLTRLRLLLETDGARHSIRNGDIDWETSLVAAHHKLVYIEHKMREDEVTYFKPWNQADWEFHATLLSACGSELHRHYHKQLFDQFRQYVVLELKTNGFRGNDIVEEHEAILNAALMRDADGCVAALERHLTVYYQRSLQA